MICFIGKQNETVSLLATQLLERHVVLHAVALELHLLHVGHGQTRLEHLDSAQMTARRSVPSVTTKPTHAPNHAPEVQLLSLGLRLLHALLDLRHGHGRLLDCLLLLCSAAQVSKAVKVL